MERLGDSSAFSGCDDSPDLAVYARAGGRPCPSHRKERGALGGFSSLSSLEKCSKKSPLFILKTCYKLFFKGNPSRSVSGEYLKIRLFSKGKISTSVRKCGKQPDCQHMSPCLLPRASRLMALLERWQPGSDVGGDRAWGGDMWGFPALPFPWHSSGGLGLTALWPNGLDQDTEPWGPLE